jgi:large subunit ribosomal protein L30
MKVKDYVTWGEVSEKTVEQLVKSRARVVGGEFLTDDYVKKNSTYSDIKSFTSKLASGEASCKSIKGLKPVFRLKPPTKGFDRAGIKKPYSVGGALGYRGDKINELLVRML